MNSIPTTSDAKVNCAASFPRCEATLPALDQEAPRAIFLDLDGVVHPPSIALDWQKLQSSGISLAEFGRREQGRAFCWLPAFAGLLREHPDVLVLVHSSWRELCSRSEIQDLLACLPKEQVDVVPVNRALDRYASIRDLVQRVDIVQYLILDDDRAAFPQHCEQLALCNPHMGLSDPAVQARICEWLERTKPVARRC
jgi:hypothetical protein